MLIGLIYAAGVNTRLANKIDVPFKGMLPTLDGKSLIIRQVEKLIELGVDELVVVVGLEHARLIDHLTSYFPTIHFKFEYNPDYLTKGNMLSLWHAKRWSAENICFTTSDLFFDGHLPPNFCNPTNSKILIDNRKTELLYDPDPVKVSIKEEKIIRVNKVLKKNEVHGIAPGYYFFNSAGSSMLFDDIKFQISCGLDDQSLYSVIDRVSTAHKINPVFMKSGDWMDIDTSVEIERLYSILRTV